VESEKGEEITLLCIYKNDLFAAIIKSLSSSIRVLWKGYRHEA